MEQQINYDNRGEVIQSRCADLEGLHLKYELYETDFTVHRRRAYSIVISVTSPTGEEWVCACDVTRIKKHALSLFRLVCDGLVTPCTLLDILEDLL